MDFIQLFSYFLVLIVPGFIGALAFSIAARIKIGINIFAALILDLFTFTTMITGLYYLKCVLTMDDLIYQFTCLSFTRKYILLSMLIVIFWGVLFGFICRLFFRIRCSLRKKTMC